MIYCEAKVHLHFADAPLNCEVCRWRNDCKIYQRLSQAQKLVKNLENYLVKTKEIAKAKIVLHSLLGVLDVSGRSDNGEERNGTISCVPRQELEPFAQPKSIRELAQKPEGRRQ